MHPGTRMGPYAITASIGVGGMGEVFRARDTRLNRDVAIKVLPKDFASDADRLRRFEQEAKTLAALNHPNILTIHDAGVHQGAPYLVSELLEGRTLREEVKGAALLVRKATDYALQIAHGLAAAHAKGVIHRDLKPENIFVTNDGRVKILDFGLAKLRHPPPGPSPLGSLEGERVSGPAATIRIAPEVILNTTEPGVVLGTPAYMSPEQVRGEPADHRADIFAFGAVLYEMLSGTWAFRRDTPVASMNAVLKEEPPELAETLPTLSLALNRIVHRCLEKSPERRFQTASDLGFALESLSGATPPSATRKRQQQGPRLLRHLLASVLALAIAGVAFLVGRSSRAPVNAPAISWRAERLGGPTIALTPKISPDGNEIAFAAMVDGQSQLAIMILDSGDWMILTTNRNRGLLSNIFWSPDGSQIFYDRIAGGPNGVYRISKYGGEERLVLEAAMCPKVRPDGSILFARRNSEGRIQLYLYRPETEQVRALDALPELGMITGVALLGDGAAVFRGRRTNDVASPKSFWRIDLTSGASVPFLTNVTANLQFRETFPFAISRDGARFIFDEPAESLHRIFAVDLKAPDTIIPLLVLTSAPLAIDTDRAGNIYVDQSERPNEVLRHNAGHAGERIPLSSSYEDRTILPLPGDRFLFASSARGASRLTVIEPNRGERLFLESKLESSAPFSLLGSDQLLFTLREGPHFLLASASLEGRSVRRIQKVNWQVSFEMSAAGSPDGQTVFYAEDGSIYSVAASGGEPQKLCSGHSVAVAPAGHYLIVKHNAASENYLVRYSLSNRTEQRIERSGKYPLTGAPLAANAVARDGRILVEVSPFDSWLWPAAIVNPQTGETKLATEYQADMYSPGWDIEGRLVTSAMFFRSSIWRFRPENKRLNQ